MHKKEFWQNVSAWREILVLKTANSSRNVVHGKGGKPSLVLPISLHLHENGSRVTSSDWARHGQEQKCRDAYRTQRHPGDFSEQVDLLTACNPPSANVIDMYKIPVFRHGKVASIRCKTKTPDGAKVSRQNTHATRCVSHVPKPFRQTHAHHRGEKSVTHICIHNENGLQSQETPEQIKSSKLTDTCYPGYRSPPRSHSDASPSQTYNLCGPRVYLLSCQYPHPPRQLDDYLTLYTTTFHQVVSSYG